jgi:hypothetical protein
VEETEVKPYRELVGAPAWIALDTRPDIVSHAGFLARFGHNPGGAHWEAAKWALRDLKGAEGFCLVLGGKTWRVTAYRSHRDDRRFDNG